MLYSGGTASTTLLSTAAAATGPVITCAVDQDAGDVVRSGRAASMLGRARELESRGVDAAGLARQLAAVADEPVGDPAAITHLSMCLASRRHASIALAAHGAATLWAGLARHRVERMEALARSWLRGPFGSLGAEIGRSLDQADRQMALQAEYQALEYGRAGLPVEWRGSASGNYGEILVGPSYEVNRLDCREFTHTVYIGGRARVARGVACRQPDATWRIVG